MLSIRGDFTQLNDLLSRIHQFYKNRALKIAASRVLSDVKDNMSKGVDAQGTPHKPYTNRYKSKREKLSKQTDHVDFEVTHGLKDSLNYDVNDQMIGVDAKHEKIAEGLQTGVGKKKVNPRNWLDAGDATGKRIETDIAKAIEDGP